MRWPWEKRNGTYQPSDLDRKIEQEETRSQIVGDQVRITCAANKALVNLATEALREQLGQLERLK